MHSLFLLCFIGPDFSGAGTERYFSVNFPASKIAVSDTGKSVPAPTKISWYLVRVENPSADQIDAYNRITLAMNAAVATYNQYTKYCSGNLRVEYNTNVATADGNSNGTIRFGANRSYMNQRTAMHEIAHTQGVGTTARWQELCVDGKYTGIHGLQVLRSFEGESQSSTLNADGHSFWPYGLNYDSEWSTFNAQRNALIVDAFQRDGV